MNKVSSSILLSLLFFAAALLSAGNTKADIDPGVPPIYTHITNFQFTSNVVSLSYNGSTAALPDRVELVEREGKVLKAQNLNWTNCTLNKRKMLSSDLCAQIDLDVNSSLTAEGFIVKKDNQSVKMDVQGNARNLLVVTALGKTWASFIGPAPYYPDPFMDFLYINTGGLEQRPFGVVSPAASVIDWTTLEFEENVPGGMLVYEYFLGEGTSVFGHNLSLFQSVILNNTFTGPGVLQYKVTHPGSVLDEFAPAEAKLEGYNDTRSAKTLSYSDSDR